MVSRGLHFRSVFLECTIFHIRLALSRDKWNDTDLDTVITLWRYLVQGICDRIETGYYVDLANRSNTKNGNSPSLLKERTIALPRQACRANSPLGSHLALNTVRSEPSSGCFPFSFWSLCRSKTRIDNAASKKCPDK
ncbi:unnamed protein product [Anisakis simplex]|uniref:Uncharacterized protein n=1 Tax=Anisakis simplex TaxID=6269 RepID=A0A0M3KBN2_ANISI|nr:unnamed protein product [Anisakis simplex]